MTLYLASFFFAICAFTGAGYILLQTLKTTQADNFDLRERLFRSKGLAAVGKPAEQTPGAIAQSAQATPGLSVLPATTTPIRRERERAAQEQANR